MVAVLSRQKVSLPGCKGAFAAWRTMGRSAVRAQLRAEQMVRAVEIKHMRSVFASWSRHAADALRPVKHLVSLKASASARKLAAAQPRSSSAAANKGDSQIQELEDMLQHHDMNMASIQEKIDTLEIRALRWRGRSNVKHMHRMSQLCQARQDLNLRRVLHGASILRSSSEPPECVTSSSSSSSPPQSDSPSSVPRSSPRTRSHSQVSTSSGPWSSPRTLSQSRLRTSSPQSSPRTTLLSRLSTSPKAGELAEARLKELYAERRRTSQLNQQLQAQMEDFNELTEEKLRLLFTPRSSPRAHSSVPQISPRTRSQSPLSTSSMTRSSPRTQSQSTSSAHLQSQRSKLALSPMGKSTSVSNPGGTPRTLQQSHRYTTYNVMSSEAVVPVTVVSCG